MGHVQKILPFLDFVLLLYDAPIPFTLFEVRLSVMGFGILSKKKRQLLLELLFVG